jgi:hypothetical protein
MINIYDFLAKFPPPGNLIFAKVWGSRSHNTHKEESDTDYAGVYILPTSQLLSCRLPQEPAPPETWKVDESKDKVAQPDRQFHEVGRFAELLLKGNPGLVEMLYTDRMCSKTPDWQELIHNRRCFLSKEVVKQYLGFMQGQYKRLQSGQRLNTSGGVYCEKWAYHILRLAGDAKRICEMHDIQVWKEGPERDFLMQVRNEQIPWEDVCRMIDSAIHGIDALLKTTTLPEHGDKHLLNGWLLDLRMRYW